MGQGPVDSASDEIIGGTIQEQTARTLENIDVTLTAANCSLDYVVKTTIFIRDMDDYEALNEVYTEYVSQPYPTRSAVEVADLLIDISDEIEVVASTGSTEE